MSKEEKTPETKAEEYVETEFVKEMAVEPVEVPDVTYEGELIGWAEHTPHEHEHHEHHKEDPEELVETEFVKEMAVEPVEVPDVTYEGEIVGEFDPKAVTVEELGLYMAGAQRNV